MSCRLEYEATLGVRACYNPERIEFALDDGDESYFDEWWADKENLTLSFNGGMYANDLELYLRELLRVFRRIAPFIEDDEDVYVLNTDASWPTGWRYVFKDGDVKCYEGMMIFVEEVTNSLV